MAVWRYDFWDPSDGSLLGSLEDTDLIAAEVRPALFQLGAGSLTVSRHQGAASLAMLKKGTLVTYTLPHLSDEIQPWGFVLRDDITRLISRAEKGGEHITLTGPGMMSVVGNATLDEETWAPAPPASTERGSSDTPGQWFWREQPFGAIYTRSIEEGQNEPGTPLGLVTIDFDRDEDSDGDPWAEIQLDYMVDTGTNVLELGDRLAMTGGFFPVMVPNVTGGVLGLELSAYQSIGQDLTSSVRFAKAPTNDIHILTELERQRQATRITHLLIRDADGVFLPVYETPNPYDQAVWKQLNIDETNDTDTLDKIAATALSASEDQAEEFTFEHDPGAIIFDTYQLGDTVTLHTGTDEHDLNESPQQVMAARVVLDVAVSDASQTHAQRSLRTVVELGYRDTSGLSGTNPDGEGCSCPKPCRPGHVAEGA